MPGIEWLSTCDNKDFIRSMNEMTAQVRQTKAVIDAMGMDGAAAMKQMNSIGKDFVGTLREIGAVAGVSFSVAQAKSFVDKIVETRGYFQDIESSMKVFLGNEQKAKDFTDKLRDYAYYNMFEFSDLANASKQMIAYGHNVDSIIPRLDQLSNVARGTSAPLMEMVNAYNRAKNLGGVGARDLQSWAAKGLVIKDILKEMGEEANGTSVTFEQLNKVLDHVTGEGGMFHNLMGEQLNNITAEQGQLEDNLTAMYNEIGEKYQDTITGVIKAESWLVDHYKEVGTVIMSLIAAYGEYRAAIVTTNAFRNVRQETVKNLEIEMLDDEIAKYKELVSEKEAARNADLAEAVAKGKLTEEQASLIAAKRAELEQVQIEKELLGVDEKINELKRLKLDEDLQDKVATEQLTLAQAQEVQQRREVLRSLDEEIAKRKEAEIAKVEQSMALNEREIGNFQKNSAFNTQEAEKYQKEIDSIEKQISQMEILGGKEKEIYDLNERKNELLEKQAIANDKIISNTDKIKSLQESNVELARREEEIMLRYGNANEKLDILNNQKISLEQQYAIAQKDAEERRREYDIIVQTRLAEEDELRVLKEKLAKEQAINEERAKNYQMPNDLSALSQQVDDQQAVVDALNDATHAKQENSMATAAQEAAEKAQNIQEQINTLEEQANSIATGTNTKAKAGNTTATNALTVSEKIHNAALIAGTTASKIFTTAVNQVKVAIKGLGAAIMTNPIGVLVGALTIGLPWLMEWISGSDDAAEAEERYGNEAKEAASKVDSLLSVIKQTDSESKVHKDSVSELERIYKDYGIELEKTKDAHGKEIVTVKELEKHHKDLVDVLRQEAIERQRANDISDANKEYDTETEEATKRVRKGLSDTFTKSEKNQLANYLGEEDYEKVTEALYKYKKALEEAKKTYGDSAYKYVIKEYEEYNNALDEAQNKVVELAKAMTDDSDAQQDAGKWARWQAERYAELGTEQKEMIDNANKAAAATWKASDAQDANARKIRYAKMSTSELKKELEMMVQAYGDTKLHVTIDFEQRNVPEWMKGMDLGRLKQQSSFWATQAGDMMKKQQKERIISGQKFSVQDVVTKANQYRIARESAEAAKEAADAEAERRAEEAKRHAGEAKRNAERLAKETAARNAKELQDQWKHEEDMSKLESDARRARAAATIAGIRNDAERERAEREQQHRQTLEDLERQEDEIYKNIYEQRKKAWELAHKDSPYENTPEGKGGWMALRANTLSEAQRKERDILEQAGKGDLMKTLQEQFSGGNVDLIARPMIEAAELVKKGWKDAGDGIATVFSYQRQVQDAQGSWREILVTPILPDGTVLSEAELNAYIDKQLGGKDILEADTKGLVIKLGEAGFEGDLGGDALQQLHEQLIDLPTDKLKEIQTLYANIDTKKFDAEELKQYRLGMDILESKRQEADANERRRLEEQKELERQHWIEYLEEYGSFEEKKLAITEKYNTLINEANDDYQKERLRKQMKAELDAVEKADFQKTKEYLTFFSAIYSMTEKEAKSIGEKIKENLDESLKNGTVSAHDYYEEIEKINEQLDKAESNRGAFMAFMGGGLSGLSDYFSQVGRDKQRAGAIQVEDSEKRLQELRERAKKGEFNLAEQMAANEAKAAGMQMKEAGEAMSNAGGEMSNTIAMIDLIINGIDAIVQGFKNIMDEVKDIYGEDYGLSTKDQNFWNAFSEASSGAASGWNSLKDGDIQGAVNGTIQSWTGWLKMESAETSRWKQLEEHLKKLESALSFINSRLADQINMLNGMKAQTAGENLTKNYQLLLEQTRENAYAWTAAKTLHHNHRNWWYVERGEDGYGYNDMNWQKAFPEIAQQFGMTEQELDGIGGLAKLSREQLLWIQEHFQELWIRLPEEFRGYLEDIITYADKIDETAEDITKSRIGLDLQTLKDDYADFASSIDDENEEVGKNFEGYLRKAIMSNLIGNKFTERINDIIKKADKIAEKAALENRDISREEYNSIKEEEELLRKEIQERKDYYSKLYGWESESNNPDKQATYNSLEKWTYDQADELISRVTAMQIIGEHQYGIQEQILATLQTLSGITTPSNGDIGEIRNLVAISNDYLLDIKRSNEQILGNMNDRLDKITNVLRQM